IPMSTLRVWEQRYGFPKSARTAGGHRLYSERDIQRITWVKESMDGGMKTSQAIRALESLEQEQPANYSRPASEERRPATMPVLEHIDRKSRAALNTIAGRLLSPTGGWPFCPSPLVPGLYELTIAPFCPLGGTVAMAAISPGTSLPAVRPFASVN